MRLFSTIVLSIVFSSLAFSQEGVYAEPDLFQFNGPTEEVMPIISPDGNTMYFSRVASSESEGIKKGKLEIMSSTKNADGEWTEPAFELGILNNSENNAIVGISNDGNTIYLLNVYLSNGSMKQGVSYATKQGGIWGIPQALAIPGLTEQVNHYGFFMNGDENVLMISIDDKNSLGNEDLYVSLKKGGTWSKPIHLGKQVNTTGFEIAPFLDKNNTTLYFTTNGRGGYGDGDVFVTFRKDSTWTNWTRPVNLGPTFNSEGFDSYFYKTSKGDIYFTSNRKGGYSDIYHTTVLSDPGAIANRSVDPYSLHNPNLGDFGAAQEGGFDHFPAIGSSDPGMKITEYEVYTPGPKTYLNNINREALPDVLRVYFAIGKYDLERSSKELLNTLIVLMKIFPDLKVTLVGHTDDIGGEDFNLELSRYRAYASQNYLIDNGIDGARVDVRAEGKHSPLIPASTPEARGANRRVDIILK